MDQPLRTNGQAKSPTRAFSLPEVIIALTVIGILFATGFAALHQALMISHNSELRAEANELIQNEIEYIRSLSWDDLVSSLQEYEWENQPSPSSPLIVKLTPDTITPNGIVTLKFEVSWVDVSGVSHAVNIITKVREKEDS